MTEKFSHVCESPTMIEFRTSCAALAFLCLVPCSIAQNLDETPDEDPILKKEQSLMSGTVVTVLHDDGTHHAAKMREAPVLRYVDERLKIGGSTIWVGKDQGRPVAIQKIEVNKSFKPAGWTYNLSALSDARIEVTWPNVGRSYKSQKPLDFQLIPDAPTPLSGPRLKFQSRALSRQFSGNWGPDDNRHQMRVVPTPLLEYQSDEHGIVTGAIYSMAIGTHPIVYLIIELRETPAGTRWQYASGRAASAQIRLFHNETEVRAQGQENRPGQFPTWTYMFLPGGN